MDCIVFPRPISSFQKLQSQQFCPRQSPRPTGQVAARIPCRPFTWQATEDCTNDGRDTALGKLRKARPAIPGPQPSRLRHKGIGDPQLLACPGLVAQQLGLEAFRRRCIRLLHSDHRRRGYGRTARPQPALCARFSCRARADRQGPCCGTPGKPHGGNLHQLPCNKNLASSASGLRRRSSSSACPCAGQHSQTFAFFAAPVLGSLPGPLRICAVSSPPTWPGRSCQAPYA